jgi:hypothetical protein
MIVPDSPVELTLLRRAELSVAAGAALLLKLFLRIM